MSEPFTAPCPTPALATEARKQYRWLETGLIVLLALACAYPFTLNLTDPDLWGHVRYGQDWLAAGEMPRTATHTFTAIDYPWVNHENAAELLFAVSYEHIGIYGMLVGKCLLGLAIVATMTWTAYRHGVPVLSTMAFMLLVSTAMQAFFPMRPQLLSFALCTLALVCLDRGFPEWPERRTVRMAWLWALPVIFIAWVNSHGGFMAGLCIVGTLLFGRMCELLIRDGRSSFRQVVGLAFIGIACLAATAANPYGLGMHQWLWEVWAGAPPEITEWAPPRMDTPVFWPFVCLAAVAVISLAASRRPRDWTQIVILSLVAWQASLHLRHIAFVALLAGFWLPVHWHSALLRLRPGSQLQLPVVLPPLWFRATMAFAILVGIVVQGAVLAERLTNLPVRRDAYPVDAIQFMTDNGLTGKAVVGFNWSQYAIAALAPDLTVGFDGRFDTCYPQEAIDIHFDFLLGDMCERDRRPDAGPIDGAKALEYGNPDLVLFSRGHRHGVNVMQQEAARPDSDWTLLYSDSLAELWGRRSRYDDPASPFFFPSEKRRFDVKIPDTSVQWPAFPQRQAPAHAPQQPQQPQQMTEQLSEL